ncbi:hypothetical protein H0E87_031472, partial [Populus deltoides]
SRGNHQRGWRHGWRGFGGPTAPRKSGSASLVRGVDSAGHRPPGRGNHRWHH